jgi:hypothetical protein
MAPQLGRNQAIDEPIANGQGHGREEVRRTEAGHGAAQGVARVPPDVRLDDARRLGKRRAIRLRRALGLRLERWEPEGRCHD